MQNTSPSSSPQQSHIPAKRLTKKRFIKFMARIAAVLGVIGTLVGILQFTFGIQNLPSLFSRPTPTPSPTPTPLPLPAIHSPYDAPFPGCNAFNDNWYLHNATIKCSFLGTQL